MRINVNLESHKQDAGRNYSSSISMVFHKIIYMIVFRIWSFPSLAVNYHIKSLYDSGKI